MKWEKQEGRGKVWILSTCPNEKDFDEKNKKEKNNYFLETDNKNEISVRVMIWLKSLW